MPEAAAIDFVDRVSHETALARIHYMVPLRVERDDKSETILHTGRRSVQHNISSKTAPEP